MKSLLALLVIVVLAGLGYLVLRDHGSTLSGSGGGSSAGGGSGTQHSSPVKSPDGGGNGNGGGGNGNGGGGDGGGGRSGPPALTSCGAASLGGPACTIHGDGFQPGERVVLSYTWPGAEPSEYPTRANPDGTFNYNVNSHGRAGTVRVHAVGQASGSTADTSFTDS